MGQRPRESPLFPRTIPRRALMLLQVPGTLRKVKAVHLSSSVPSGDSMRPTRQAFQISRTKSGVGICCRKTQGKALEGPPLHLRRPPGIRLGYN